MEKKPIFSQELCMILASHYKDANGEDKIGRAIAQAKKYFQSTVSSPHIFLATFELLVLNKDKNEEINKIYSKLRDILNRYNITGKKFEEVFLKYYPKGEEPEAGSTYKISPSREYNAISDNLRKNAKAEFRTMELSDLIVEMFSDHSYDIYDIFTEFTGSDAESDKLYKEVLDAFKAEVVPEISDLEEMPELTNLNKWLKSKPQVIVDADDPVRKIEVALAGRSIRNAILTGKAGTGKTCYVYEFVQRIINGNVPESFKDKVVYQLDTGALVAGTKFRGDLEQKLTNILTIIKEHPNVILFIDEIHSFLNGGASSDDSSMSCGNLIKPYLTRGELQIIGCTTNEEFTKFIKKDKAFERRFHEIKIEEPNEEQVRRILHGIIPEESKYFNKKIQDELIEKIIQFSQQYSLDLANPAKAINMLEFACAYAHVFEEKEEYVKIDELVESIKLKYGLFISEDKFTDTSKALHKELLGQDEALDQIMNDLNIVEKGLTDPDRPLWSMLLCGSTGVGKTRACEIIAKHYFGSETNIAKINMGEYSNEFDVSKLSGSAPGYVGYDDEPAIIKAVREKPNSLVLFDEIEKAHPAVQKILLSILDKGYMQDNKGNMVSFRNTIVVFTTNLGCTKDTGKATGMGFLKSEPSKDSNKAEILKAVEDYFSPEFLGRLDDIVYYNSLTNDIAEELINRYLKEYTDRSGINVNFTKEDIDEIIKNADITSRGARGIRKAVKKQIITVVNRKETVEQGS